MTETKPSSKGALIAGWIISGLITAFYLFDAISKIVKEKHSVDASVALGWPAEHIPTIGIILLACTILYAIPRTSVLGAVLITGYLGGAVAVMMRTSGQPYLFPFIFGALTWAGIYLRNTKLQKLVKGD
ncbi:DoxX family protein [Mucilaginibacter psychrotolerans]|uniref:DoxX family protein n=1 Tax=Mucilaginibacter psychrotolerans TaxID=1524096 RepID=A0A4Y8SAT3_9SPHI|nr:DoxX family protein [Mucilaginibacter psychrotolerans]TFF35771.1 DoxX family protein [Mucilaginibacter psychrotolerans]